MLYTIASAFAVIQLITNRETTLVISHVIRNNLLKYFRMIKKCINLYGRSLEYD